MSLRDRLTSVVFGLVFFASTLSADFPSRPGEDPWLNRPNDPGYGGAWFLFSHLPVDHTGKISEWEKTIGSGLHVDKAWQLHTGTPDTVIAVLDSGIFWDEDDLLDRFFLNRGELPMPQGSSSYDANGDGRFSPADYRGDSRVKDANQNGKLDPQDLILAFSDGKDDDGNGFIDDISGWDFHEHDNDAYDRTRFGHGTGEAKDSTAALNNGIGDAGVCGNCSVVPLRVNDSFVVDANAFAAAVKYATNLKVSLIQQALGSVNYSAFVKEAVEYAYRHDVPIVGSAADECSYHHNYPSTLDPVIYANAIRYDTARPQDATTFLNFNNCSNFGARVDVAVPALHCSSEATGLLSGVTALALSYAKSLGRPMSAGEAISLVKSSTVDINLGPASAQSERYSTYAGWDSTTGYGRANAQNMMTAIREDKVPPASRIVSPEWFETFRLESSTEAKIQLEWAVSRGGYRAVLEVARGVETSDGERRVLWQEEKSSSGRFERAVTLDLSTLAALKASKLDNAHFKNAFTLVLRVTNDRGATGESRRTIFVYSDPDLYTGFPAALKGSGESAGAFYDLDGDGKEEYVTADGGGWVHAFTSKGAELSGFPAPTLPSRYGKTYSSIVSPVAIADLDGDGKAEIVTLSLEGALTVLDSQGKSRVGFPLYLPFPRPEEADPSQVISQGSYAAPVLVDLDGDGKKEIVAVAMDGLIHVYRENGTPQAGYPVALLVEGKKAKILSSPAVHDINQDGVPDLILGSNHASQNNGFLFAVDGRGNKAEKLILEGFPASVPLLRDSFLPTVGTGIPASPVITDLEKDGKIEIIIQPFVGKTYAYDAKGKLVKTFSMKVGEGHETNDQFMVSGLGNPAIADLMGTGKWNVVSPGVGKKMLVAIALGGKRVEIHHMLGAWDTESGQMLKTFPRKMEDMILSPSPVAADLDNDGKQEVVLGSGGYYLHAFDSDKEIAGFPKFTGGWMYASPSIGDFDGDGRLDIAVTTREGKVFIWRTQGEKTRSRAWRTFKGGADRLGTLF